MACAKGKHQTCNVTKLSTGQLPDKRSFGEATQEQTSTGCPTKQTKVENIQLPNSEFLELYPLGSDRNGESGEHVEGKSPEKDLSEELTDILEEDFDENFSDGWPYPIPQDYFDGAFLTPKLQESLSPADTRIKLKYGIKSDPEFHLWVGVVGVRSQEEAQKHCPILKEKWIKMDILDQVPSICRESGSARGASEEMATKLTSEEKEKQKKVRVEVPVPSGTLSATKTVVDTSPTSSPSSTVMTINSDKRRGSQASDVSSLNSPGPTSAVSPSANSAVSPSANSLTAVSPLAAVSPSAAVSPTSTESPSATSSSPVSSPAVVHSPGTLIGAETKENEVATTLVVQYPNGDYLGTIGGFFRGTNDEIRCTSAFHCVEQAELTNLDCVARHGTIDATVRYLRGQTGLTNDTALFRVSGPNWVPSPERPDRLSTHEIEFPDRAKYTRILKHMTKKMSRKRNPIVVKFGRSTGTTAGHIISTLYESAYLTAQLPSGQGDSGALAFVRFGSKFVVVGQHVGSIPASNVVVVGQHVGSIPASNVNKPSPASSPVLSPVSTVSTDSTDSTDSTVSTASSTVSSPVSNASKSAAPAGSDSPKVALIEMVYQTRVAAQNWGDLLDGFDWGGFFLKPKNNK